VDGQTPWVPVGRAAEVLGVHPETVRRYLRDGLLRGRRLTSRGNRQIDENSVRELVAIAALPEPEQTIARDALLRYNTERRG
jgi:DNA-binding transcriptional MerR regulator